MGFSKHHNTEPHFYIFPFAAILCRSQSGGKIKIYTLTTWLTPAQGSVKWGKSFWAIFHLSKPCRTFPICPVSACSLLTEDRLARLLTIQCPGNLSTCTLFVCPSLLYILRARRTNTSCILNNAAVLSVWLTRILPRKRSFLRMFFWDTDNALNNLTEQ